MAQPIGTARRGQLHFVKGHEFVAGKKFHRPGFHPAAAELTPSGTRLPRDLQTRPASCFCDTQERGS